MGDSWQISTISFTHQDVEIFIKGSHTSTFGACRVSLLEDDDFVHPKIFDIEPSLLGMIMETFRFSISIMIYDVNSHAIDPTIQSTHITERKRPIVARPVKTFPDAVRYLLLVKLEESQ